MFTRILFVILFSVLVSCASEPVKRNDKILVVAVAGERILVGVAKTFGTSGKFEMKSITNPPIDCTGSFNYINLPKGKAVFRCSNDERGLVRIELDGNLTGTGKGTSSFGPVQLAYGYSLEKMNTILGKPKILGPTSGLGIPHFPLV